MKQLLVIIVCGINSACFGQTVPGAEDSVALASMERAKEAPKSVSQPQYEKFVRISVSDFNTLINALNRVKELEMYNPRVTDKDKVENFKWIGDYIDGLSRRVKVDSAIVTKPLK